MRTPEVQELVRELIVETDHLSRKWHGADVPNGAWRMEALRSTLQRLERHLGGTAPRFWLAGDLDVVYQRVLALASELSGGIAHDEVAHLLARAEGLRHERPRRFEARVRILADAVKASFGRRLALGVGAAMALLMPLAVPGLRRSRAGWGVAVGVAVIALAPFAIRERRVFESSPRLDST